MKEVFTALREALARGERAVVCTIIDADGSTPRGAGARMAVFQDGREVGTIGGGAMEYRASLRAKELFASDSASASWRCRLHPNETDDIDAVCGGEADVFFQVWRPEPSALALLDAALAALDRRENSWLMTTVHEDGTWTAAVLNGKDDTASAPDCSCGDLRSLCRRKPVWDGRRFVEPLGMAGRVYVFGGGHVSQALVPVLTRVSFPVVVCENRAEFARPELFPTAEEVALLEFSALPDRFSIGADDCLVIMTRGHRDDYQVLTRSLATDAGYIGVIGSRRKAEVTFARLREDGWQDRDLARIHTPIGLQIGAETPEEIAVSVAAELIAHRAGRMRS